MNVCRPQGEVELEGITDRYGHLVTISRAFERGWLLPARDGADQSSSNLFVDQGRQVLAYAFGFRAPLENYTVQKFGVGTGVTTTRVTDVALESPITLSNGGATKAIDSVDFLTPFVVRVAFTLGLADANGYIISEMGLYSGNNTLIARKVRAVSISKTSDFSPSLFWRVRFVIPFLVCCVSLLG